MSADRNTGPRRRNADKGGTRAMLRELRQALRDQAEALKNVG